MAKARTVFFCQQCGAQSPKWIGHCPSCDAWNSYVEEVTSSRSGRERSFRTPKRKNSPRLLSAISALPGDKIKTPMSQFDRLLGGGIVPGSLVLLGGEPGIGKSTLLLQVAMGFKGMRVLYVTGEESEQQVRMRADRLRGNNAELYVLNETSLQQIFEHAGTLRPALIIADSVQTLYTDRIESSPGSISQLRECAAEFQRFSKTTATSVFLIGHITKDGSIAGPKALEHIVDTVLQFEGDPHYMFRILRVLKNRFGPASELGIYEMRHDGMQEVSDPAEILISHREKAVSGVAAAAILEGTRPILIEVEALVSKAAYGTPQRSSTGYDFRRLNMLLAVLEKKCGIWMGNRDVFLNVAGGIRLSDPAADLAVLAAILSSATDIPVEPGRCFAAEAGLTGELRPVNQLDRRIAEAAKLGFKKIFIPHTARAADGKDKPSIEAVQIRNVETLHSRCFSASP